MSDTKARVATDVGVDARAARDRRRKELLDALLAFGGSDVATLRVIICELVSELPTPSLEMAVDEITKKEEAFGETMMGAGDALDDLDETVMSSKPE